jgi:hypothetical protein
MMIKYDETALVSALRELNIRSAMAFAVCCADRLCRELVGKEKYSIISDLLRRSSEEVRSYVRGGDGSHFPNLQELIAEVMPNEETDPSFEGAVAEDACAAMVYTMLCALEADFAQCAAWTARRAYETADRYVGRLVNETHYTPAVEEFILNHEIVQRELCRQQRDLKICAENSGDYVQLLDNIDNINMNNSVIGP